jgi:hypothetical protein
MYDASDIHPAVDFANAKHQPSARRVGKGRNRFVGILRYAAQGFLALEVVPFEAANPGEQVVPIHVAARSR